MRNNHGEREQMRSLLELGSSKQSLVSPNYIRIIFVFLGVLLSLCLSHIAAAQTYEDTNYIEPLEQLGEENLLRNLSEEVLEQNNGETVEENEMQEIWDKYLHKPLNINKASAENLSELGILSLWQIEALLQYRADYGKILGTHELSYIQSYDMGTIERLKYFICFGEESPLPMNLKNLNQYGKHQLILRYQRTLLKSEAYTKAFLDKGYEGNPDKYYMRYTYQWFDRLKLGFVAEKDPGEAFFKGSQKQGFDFYTAYLYFGKWRFIKSVVLGSYALQFGQGLCLWTGGGFGKSILPNTMARSGMGIRPYSSAAEQGFFMGAATTLEWGKTDLSLFYSQTRNDASVEYSENADDVFEYISSITETGYHRTANEIEKKDKIKQTLMGGHFNVHFNKIRLGITGVYTNLDKEFLPKERLDTKFSQLPKKMYNLGFDYNLLLPKVHIFGELAYSQNGGWASLQALQLHLHTSFSLHVAHRYYARNYLNYFSSALAASSSANNEKGLNIGCVLDVYKNISLQLSADFYRFDWFTYSVDAPALGRSYQFRLDYKLFSRTFLYGVYRFKNKEITISQEQGLPSITENGKHSFRLHFKHTTLYKLELQTRVEYSFMGKSKGVLIYQDIAYTFRSFPLTLHLRYALFDTEDYNTRIYAYESDVLYAFTVPAYYDEGRKFYIVLKYDFNKNISLWLRYSDLYYNNTNSLGSGVDEIRGQWKPEIKLQLRLKF